MSAGTPVIYAPAKLKLLNAGFNLTSDALKVALTTSAQVMSPGFVGASGLARYADLTAEVASGAGYTTGGNAATGVVLSYYVAAASIVAAGTGGTNGTQTVTGTTGTGTKFTAQVTVTGGVISAVNSITLGGSYSVLPTAPSAEPVTGASLTGATLLLTMGVQLTLANPTWASLTTTAKYFVIYDNTSANKDLLCYGDLETTQGSGVSTTNGTLTVLIASTGILQLS